MKVDLNGIISVKELRGYLFPEESDVEHAVFLVAESSSTDFVVKGYRVLGRSDFDIQSSYHIQIRSETIGELIKEAHELKLSLIEIHSHVEQEEAEFSWSDWLGFEDFVPHIFWRLPGRPYGALVFADKTIDGLYWDNEAFNHKPISSVIDGAEEYFTTKKSTKPQSYGEFQ